MESAKDGAALAVVPPAMRERRCVRCGAPLGHRFWITAFPDGAHEECIDWRARPFPFARELDVLKLLSRRAAGESARALRLVLEDLTALRRRWPGDALGVLHDGRRLVDRARPHLAALDHRDRQRL